MSKKVTIVSSFDGDWYGVYIDGVLASEGHQVNAQEVLESLGYTIEFKEKNEAWFDKHGNRCPEKLEE
jgi:hypothetical protein